MHKIATHVIADTSEYSRCYVQVFKWKKIPFYTRGKLTGDESKDFILASYTNTRINQLEAEVEELKGLIRDLLSEKKHKN